MFSQLCRLVGHRRDRKRIRPYLETWRTKCVRCNFSLVRNTGGSWQPLPKLDDPSLAAPYKGMRPCEVSHLEENQSSSMAIVVERVRANRHLATDPNVPRADLIPRNDTKETEDFFLARADDCRCRANVAADSSIRLIHLEMATRYELLAREARQ